jgi:hypothetical protein
MTVTLADIDDKFAKLEALGTPDAIAWELEAQGIKAIQNNAYFCAIAQYLGNTSYSAAPGHYIPAVSVTQARVICLDEAALVRTPPLIAEFITRFDQGEYPALVAEHE